MRRTILFIVLVGILPVIHVAAQTPNPSPQPSPAASPSAKYFIEAYTLPTATPTESPSTPGSAASSAATRNATQGINPPSINLFKAVCDQLQPSDELSTSSPPSPQVDAAKIVARMGNPLPFSLEAADKNTILIYSTQEVTKALTIELRHLEKSMTTLFNSLAAIKPLAVKPFSVELFVPHALVLGDVGGRASSLNPDFKVTSIGNSGRVRITSDKPPTTCKVWTDFLFDLRRLAWQISPESPVNKLYYSTASEVSTAIAGGTSAANASTTPGGATGPTSSGAATATPAGTAGGQTPAPSASATAAAPNTTASPATANAQSTPSTSNSGASSPKISPLGSDMLVFNNASPGDDSSVVEKKRIIAQLDLPRPEMIVNASVMQNSSKSAQVVSEFDAIVQGMVGSFNDGLEREVFRAWKSLQQQTGDASYFDSGFERYVTYRYVGSLQANNDDLAAQQILDLRSDVKLTKEQAENEEEYREAQRICKVDEYCLGYSTLFHPLKPRLTDMLIAVIAAQRPLQAAKTTVAAMEEHDGLGCASNLSDYCRELQSSRARSGPTNCRTQDFDEMYLAAQEKKPPPLFLRCFLEQAESIRGADELPTGGKSRLGLLRAAIADFLFTYKLSQQYPHEFLPYELSRSADVLNAALAPFIEGFNADLRAYQDFLRADLKYRLDHLAGSRGWFPWTNKESFVNNGTVSVRTISGQQTSLSTTSQSFLDASAAPTLSDLVTAITGENPTLGTDKRPTGILGNLPLNKAQFALGALQAYQSSSAQIGRGLSLDFTPRSLATASGAEITVTLNADESASPTYFSGPKGGKSADISRVSTHDTTTRIRVDSIKLFTVSSYAAELRKSRSQIPLLPLPFVELPYIHTLAGIPLPSAKEYHTSTAVLSAIVVPTAADLAYGLTFINDRLLVGPVKVRSESGTDSADLKNSQVRKAVSLRDFREQPILEFHRKKISCLNDNGDPVCKDLKFKDVPRDIDERQ